MQESSGLAGRRPAQHQFAGVDLRRPKGYAAPPPLSSAASASQAEAGEGDPCPRCESRDTKFCYYNNYNTAQPRHFCKGCRRYWTKGGTLRNVPVGGGTRKKASSSSSSYAAAASAKPKRPYKKKRRVAPPEPVVPAAAPVASSAADPAKAPTTGSAKTTTTTVTDAASEITTDFVVPAAEDDSLAHLLQHPDDAAALDLDLCDLTTSGKSALLDPDYSFAWPPPSFDLMSTCWGTVADPDPALLFLNNLP